MGALEQLEIRVIQAGAGDVDSHEASAALPRTEAPPTVPQVLVIGCSGHARVVVDILEEAGNCRIVGLLDSVKAPGTEVFGYCVIGSDEDLPALVAAEICDSVFVAIGDNWARGRMVERVRELVPPIHFITAIHPSAKVARSATVGAGTVIMAGAVVNPGCDVGAFCILNTCSSLDHDSKVDDFSSLAPRAVTGGNVKVGAYSAIAIGAVVSHGLHVGSQTVVGAGATVLKDVPDRVVAYGSPARIIRTRNPGDSYLGEPPKKPVAQAAPAIVRASAGLIFIPVSSPEWNAYVDRTEHDFFHTANYHRVSESIGNGQAWLAVYGKPEKFVAWPYILKDIEGFDRLPLGRLRDITSVYGYAGPIAYQCADDGDFLASAWSAIVEAWRSQSVISIFARLHPLLGNHRYLHHFRNDGATAELVDEGQGEGKTVAIDLRESPDQIWNGYKRQLRQALRKLMGFGLVTTPDPEWKHFDDFVRLYYSSMKRNNSSSFYLFPGRHFRELKEALGPHGSLMITRHGDDVISAGLLIEYAGIVNLHLLATHHQYVDLSPSKLLIHETQAWARARGNRYLHLGGGRGNRIDDSLFRFKALFSSAYHPFYTCRWILDQDLYGILSAERQKYSTMLKCRTTSKTHFPAYRAPFLPACSKVTVQEESSLNENREA